MKKVAVTGAQGFVGQRVVNALVQAGFAVRAISRGGGPVDGTAESVASGDLSAAEFGPLVDGCDGVVHCAARVHVTQKETPEDAARLYQLLNVDVTRNLAEAAKQHRCQRFVFVSSVAAIRSTSASGEVIDDATKSAPNNPYGRSKLEAERALAALSSDTFHPISVRPPAVYGPGVKAWFALFSKAAKLGLPLPLGAVHNQRSFIFVDNLASAIAASIETSCTGEFIVTDSPPASTAELYRQLLRHYGYGDRAWKLPARPVEILAGLALGSRVQSLIGNAAYDGSRFAKSVAWQPEFTFEQGVEMTVKADLGRE